MLQAAPRCGDPCPRGRPLSDADMDIAPPTPYRRALARRRKRGQGSNNLNGQTFPIVVTSRNNRDMQLAHTLQTKTTVVTVQVFMYVASDALGAWIDIRRSEPNGFTYGRCKENQ